MMRNYRELTDEEVQQLEQLYPVTPNRRLSQMFGISVDAIQDHFARPRGWQNMTSEKRTGTATPQTPADETDELLRRHDLYAEIAEPFDHRYLVIIRSADGKQLWSRRHHDLKSLSDKTLEYLRNYRNNE